MADIAIKKTVYVVFREQPSGCWTEIYRTPNEADANAEATKMASWDARTKVQPKIITLYKQIDECEFCGEPATKLEFFDREVPVCDECSAE